MSCDTEAGRQLAAMLGAPSRAPVTAEDAEGHLRHASACEACGAALAADPALCEALISATQVAGVSPAVASFLEDEEAAMRMAASELLAALPDGLRRRLEAAPRERFERAWGAADSNDPLEVLRCAAALSEATLLFNTALAESRRVVVTRAGDLAVGGRNVPAAYVAGRLADAACVDDEAGRALWAAVREHLLAEGVRLPGFVIARADEATFAVEPEDAGGAGRDPQVAAGAAAAQAAREAAGMPFGLLETLRQAVCYNQAAYIQYAFLAAEKHKALKDELFRKPVRNADAIERHLVGLVQFLNLELFEALKRNFEFLHRVFDERAPARPRICIKGNFRGARQSGRVVTVIRDRSSGHLDGCAVEENTAFHEVFKQGTCYLGNDLPAEYEAGRYRNPRLTPITSCTVASIRKEWPRLWLDFEPARDASAWYRSTLVVPMTLWNNKLKPEFRKTIRMQDVGRVIFGFLCFDHVDTGYFSKALDVPVGYVFADLLSQYLITRLVYTEISQTFQVAEQCIAAARAGAAGSASAAIDRLIASQDLDSTDTIDGYLRRLPVGGPFGRGAWGADFRTGSLGNQLFYADRFLADFAQKWSHEARSEARTKARDDVLLDD